MIASYHIHSIWSDGQGSFEDYILQAQKESLPEIGFSDHYVVSPQGKPHEASMPRDAIDSYLAAIEKAQKEHPDIIIRKGLEVDFFQETIGPVKKLLEKRSFDYLIGSVHVVDGIVIDHTPHIWIHMSQEERNRFIRNYWKLITKMAQSKAFDIVGHLDLWKKFGFSASIDLDEEINQALDAIVKADMAVELNTAGWHFPCKEAYPSPSILKLCSQKKIPIIISSDAHLPQNLSRDFPEAKKLLKKMGFTHLAYFEKRKRSLHPF